MSSKEVALNLREQNLALLSQYLPDLYQKMAAHIPQTQLVCNEDGDWDVVFRGEFLYGPGGRARLDAGIGQLRGTTKGRVSLGAPHSKNVDLSTGEFLFHFLKRATDEKFTFSMQPQVDDSYHFVSFGFGLGYHIEPIIKLSNCKSICIVEPNLDFLYHSLDVFDWKILFELSKENKIAVEVFYCSSSVDMAISARLHCRYTNPFALDSLLIFSAYPNDAMLAAMDIFRRDAQLITMGLGFFEDEMEMVRASYHNLLDGNFRFLRRCPVPISTPAFIVGSGPSVDADLDFLRKNQDRGIIFACGTAIRVLLANGIRPDFAVVLENGEAPANVFEEIGKVYGFKKIVFIGSNTVSTKFKKLFNDIILFFRYSLSSYPLFCPGHAYSLFDAGPTVTNTACAAAQALGFREYYFFGVDYGTRDPVRHHSRDSVYKIGGHEKKRRKGETALDLNDQFNIIDLANFGGLMRTHEIFAWSRDTMARIVGRMSAGSVVYNCSDGLLIAGAKPKVSTSIKLTSTPEAKNRDLALLVENCPRETQELFERKWKAQIWKYQVKKKVDEIKAAVSKTSILSGKFLETIYQQLFPDIKRMPRFEEFFIRGSVSAMAMGVDYYIRRVSKDEDRERFGVLAMEEFKKSLDEIVRRTEWYFDHIDELKTADDLETRLGDWRDA